MGPEAEPDLAVRGPSVIIVAQAFLSSDLRFCRLGVLALGGLAVLERLLVSGVFV